MNSNFSESTRLLISKARELAIELRSDGIASIHLFLADCITNDFFSIRNFAFQSNIEFEDFYKSLLDIESGIIYDDQNSIPLTKPCEQAIKLARSEQKKFLDSRIEPYHIFLAMSKLKKSQFVSFFPNNADLYKDLIDYYRGIGCISYIKDEQSILSRIKSRMGFNSE